MTLQVRTHVLYSVMDFIFTSPLNRENLYCCVLISGSHGKNPLYCTYLSVLANKPLNDSNKPLYNNCDLILENQPSCHIWYFKKCQFQILKLHLVLDCSHARYTVYLE